MQEIERKYLIPELPSLNQETKVNEVRYFLYIDDSSEIRIQQKGERYTLQTKTTEDSYLSNKQTIELTKAQFDFLKDKTVSRLERESFALSDFSAASIKVYRGEFEGLVRAEVEFDSREAAEQFVAPDWFGKEITESPLGRDSKLTKLDHDEFARLLSMQQ